MAICDLDETGDLFEDAWDVIVREHSRYEMLARRMCRGHWDLIPELMSEVYARAVQVSETWDPTIGSLRAHMWSSISRYLYKYMCQREKLVAREGTALVDSSYVFETSNIEAKDEVESIRRKLTAQQYWLIEARHVKHYKYEFMGELLPEALGGPVSTALVKKLYFEAMRVARSEDNAEGSVHENEGHEDRMQP